MNKLFLGFSKTIELPKRKFLFIDDDFDDETLRIPHARLFDPREHSFNPLKDITYKKARELTDVLYTTTPQGENTLTVRNGKRALLQAMLKAKHFDDIKGDEEVTGMIADLLASPVLTSVLCNPLNEFFRKENSVVLARLNRAELGDFDALVLGLLLINHCKGQVVIKDFGFYGRDGHVSLIREQRLIAGVNFLDELPPKLRHSMLLIKDKNAQSATVKDAELLANYSGFVPGQGGHTSFIQEAIA